MARTRSSNKAEGAKGTKRLSPVINEQLKKGVKRRLESEIHYEIQKQKRRRKNVKGNTADVFEGTDKESKEKTEKFTGLKRREEDESEGEKVTNEIMDEDTDEIEEELDENIFAIIDEDIHKIEIAGKYLVKLIREKIKLKKEYLPEKTYGFYDYRSWNPEWQTSLSSSDSIIKFMFGVTDDVPYYRKCFQLILDEVFNEMKKDKLLIQKFFKFYMSLPIFEYEYSDTARTLELLLFNRPTPLGAYGVTIGNFRYKHVEINEEECRETIDDISRRLTIAGVRPFNVRPRDCQNVKDLKDDIILKNSYQSVIEPLCLLLQEISGERCELTFGKKRVHNEFTSDNIKYVDSALYLKGTSQMLCCYEFKQFPIMYEYYLPDWIFNIGKLFEDEPEIDNGTNEKALLKYLKQLELEMISHRIDRGILSDSYTFIFIIIDLERFEKEIKGNLKEGADFKPRDIPINYNVASYHSGELTVREYLLDFNYRSLRTEKELKEVRKKMEILEKY